MSMSIKASPDGSNLKWVPGWEGKYRFSTCGEHIISVRRKYVPTDRVLPWKKNKEGYLKCYLSEYGGTSKTYFKHQAVYEFHNGKISEGLVIDHINRDINNNNISNLRIATRRENSCNNSTNTSGYPGVSYAARDEKWTAYIHFKNKKVHLGSYESIEEAYAARLDGEENMIKNFGGVECQSH